MIEIEINNDRRNFSDINPNWIHEQVKSRLDQGVSVCIRIFVKLPNIDVVFSCGNCDGGIGGSRQLTSEEERIFDLWDKFGCKESPINTGKIIAFLNQIK